MHEFKLICIDLRIIVPFRDLVAGFDQEWYTGFFLLKCSLYTTLYWFQVYNTTIQ